MRLKHPRGLRTLKLGGKGAEGRRPRNTFKRAFFSCEPDPSKHDIGLLKTTEGSQLEPQLTVRLGCKGAPFSICCHYLRSQYSGTALPTDCVHSSTTILPLWTLLACILHTRSGGCAGAGKSWARGRQGSRCLCGAGCGFLGNAVSMACLPLLARGGPAVGCPGTARPDGPGPPRGMGARQGA